MGLSFTQLHSFGGDNESGHQQLHIEYWRALKKIMLIRVQTPTYQPGMSVIKLLSRDYKYYILGF